MWGELPGGMGWRVAVPTLTLAPVIKKDGKGEFYVPNIKKDIWEKNSHSWALFLKIIPFHIIELSHNLTQ